MLGATASHFDTRVLILKKLICRGIEVVITGLTRNQFVPKAHEGSNPSLCAKKTQQHHTVWLCFFLLAQRERILTMRRSRRVRIFAAECVKLACKQQGEKSSSSTNIPPDTPCGCPFYLAHRSGRTLHASACEGTAMCRSDATHYAGYGIRIAVCAFAAQSASSSLVSGKRANLRHRRIS